MVMSFSLLFVSGCHLVDIFESHLFCNWFGIALNSEKAVGIDSIRQDRDVDCNKFNAIYNPLRVAKKPFKRLQTNCDQNTNRPWELPQLRFQHLRQARKMTVR